MHGVPRNMTLARRLEVKSSDNNYKKVLAFQKCGLPFFLFLILYEIKTISFRFRQFWFYLILKSEQM